MNEVIYQAVAAKKRGFVGGGWIVCKHEDRLFKVNLRGSCRSGKVAEQCHPVGKMKLQQQLA